MRCYLVPCLQIIIMQIKKDNNQCKTQRGCQRQNDKRLMYSNVVKIVTYFPYEVIEKEANFILILQSLKVLTISLQFTALLSHKVLS